MAKEAILNTPEISFFRKGFSVDKRCLFDTETLESQIWHSAERGSASPEKKLKDGRLAE